MDLGLTDRACIVTGGSRGIGLEVARLLVAEGARVLLVGRGEAALKQAAVVSVGRARMAGLPPTVTALAWPTGTSSSVATVVPDWVAGAGPVFWLLPGLPLSLPPQAARTTVPAAAPATATPVVRTVRRVGE